MAGSFPHVSSGNAQHKMNRTTFITTSSATALFAALVCLVFESALVALRNSVASCGAVPLLITVQPRILGIEKKPTVAAQPPIVNDKTKSVGRLGHLAQIDKTVKQLGSFT